ncbi:substrate-binding domain-containing protein [Paenibacillus massiliensis]|uniref:substrate-binding domain-containing protein n=1 Tax=Paenibacillus massiliensis TaxID=225917 RepID=UPI00046EEAD9|nr:substrate-binding domain-containing protein [Paenibacillus massiliensis]
MKKALLIYVVLIGLFALYVFRYEYASRAQGTWEEHALQGTLTESYVMITFQSGLEYWKGALKGFEDAADALGVTAEYRGATRYDVQEQTTVIEQVIARKPAGIAISAIDPTSVVPAINKAIDAGIPVVLFDAGAPGSRAYSFLGTDNYQAGITAADQMAEWLDGTGEVAVLTLPGQQNHMERTRGFMQQIQTQYPAIQVVEVADGEGDAKVSNSEALRLMTEHPRLTGIFVTEATGAAGVGEAVRNAAADRSLTVIAFDTNKATLDMIKDGTISATVAQGTWNMGYWSLQYLFHLQHGLTVPAPSPTAPTAPLPVTVDTGISLVTRQNVDDFYAK